MTVLGFIPGLDVISDAFFLGRALIDVALGRGSVADVLMGAAALLLPIGVGAFKAVKKIGGVVGDVKNAAREVEDAAEVAEAGKAIGRADEVGNAAKGPRPKYTTDSDTHVRPRHHETANPDFAKKSKFNVGEGGQKFADEVYDHPSVVARQKPNGRWEYVVEDMGRPTGKRLGTPTQAGTVVTNARGEVITQHPGIPHNWQP